MAKHVSTTSPRPTASARGTPTKPDASKRGRSPATGLHAALSASLALLDKPNAPASLSHRSCGSKDLAPSSPRRRRAAWRRRPSYGRG